jgi:hypothetical protein
MKRITLNIPSKYSHGRFMIGKEDGEGKLSFTKMKLKPTDINYFYSIVYLYRLQLLNENPNCLEIVKNKKGKRKTKYNLIESEIDFDEGMLIDYFNIKAMISGEKHNSQYDGIRNFILRFQNVYVETNLFGKDKSEKSKIIKVFANLKDNTAKPTMAVTFTKDYILPYLVTEKYFKSITLNILYLLNSGHAKLLYLLLRDYVGVSFATNTKVIAEFLGEKYNQHSINQYIKMTNQMDIKAHMERQRFGKISDKKITIRKQNWFIDADEECAYKLKQYILKKCEEITQSRTNKGIDVVDFDGYTKSVFKKLSKNVKNKFECMYAIDEILDYLKEKIRPSVDTTKPNPILVLEMKDIRGKDINYGYVINDDYGLNEFPHPNKTTTSAIETIEFIDKHFDKKAEDNLNIEYINSSTLYTLSAF